MADSMKMINKLSVRLRTVCELVTTGYAVVDVGCDHGFVPIALLESGRSPFASASDVRPGPLAAAKEHVREHHLEERIRLELCDGVPKEIASKLPEGLSASLITAGMGGLLMKQIYEDAAGELDRFSEFIASPQRDADIFRAYLREIGLVIAEERFIEEDGKYYPIIRAVRGSALKQEQDILDQECKDRFGPCLLQSKDPVLKVYLLKQENQNRKILEALEKKASSNDERKKEVESLLSCIKRALEYFR